MHFLYKYYAIKLSSFFKLRFNLSAWRMLPFVACALGGAGGVYADSWQLVWSDEFDQDGYPDTSKWSYDMGRGESVGLWGWGNNEAQYYSDRLENARVEGGRLIIEARKESMGTANYTSARMVTREKGDWLYGRIEVRAKMPAGVGTWPAIWMLPTDWEYGGWPASGEIDIMEHVGYDMGRVHGTIHTNSFNHMSGTQRGDSIIVDNVSTAFYTYSIEWEPDSIRWYVDDQLYFEFPRLSHYGPNEWPFDRRFHLILNIAIGGSWGGVQGIDDDIFPQTMEVEYVRVYQRQDSVDRPQIPGAWIYFLNPESNN